MSITILGIESSCDDTGAAVFRDGFILSNKIANQEVHKSFGGVVPELASRAHQQNIIPVVDRAIREAGIAKTDIDGVAFTRGPGLMGALLVGSSFAKSFALALKKPLIEVNHLQAHILSLFLRKPGDTKKKPEFPFLCLLVSGGHTQLVIVKDYLIMEIIGQTIDDASGEAFDKCAKVMGLPYPGGPLIDKYAASGNPDAFSFPKPQINGLDFSFSGVKTAFLYFLRDHLKNDANFIEENKYDICASIQHSIVDILVDKLISASKQTGIKEIAIAGGVSANTGLRNRILEESVHHKWEVHIPEFQFSTDNAAMISITGYYKYIQELFTDQSVTPFARYRP
ncbi:MAG: tRNA (adenosine(37)-N6)-threonylcarbamoyltransferase complex transferase subunit TsaD [Bacteroidales bacterium]|nr:tRNA (adenosine(37)-N6)-threonylcarbamoyltransferase complex transferase subunit TsaD [Bacteroidales bacterium]